MNVPPCTDTTPTPTDGHVASMLLHSSMGDPPLRSSEDGTTSEETFRENVLASDSGSCTVHKQLHAKPLEPIQRHGSGRGNGMDMDTGRRALLIWNRRCYVGIIIAD